MNKTEATTLVTMLVTFFPGCYFDAGNAAAYEAAISDLDARETHEAIATLVQTCLKLPAVAEIRNEVFRARKVARDRTVPLLPPPAETGPNPAAWGRKLGEMLDDSERYKRMAEAWYKSKGKKFPGDPAQPLIELCQAGARGDDVREKLKQTALGDTEEFEELERRYP